MGSTLLERYDDRIAGVLSCYDRVVITGTLPTVCYAAGMTKFLSANHVRIFDYPKFAEPLRERVRERAASLAMEAGIPIEHIGKKHVRKEAVVAKVLEQRGEHPGLVHIISAMEGCDTYKPWHDKQTHVTYLRPDSSQCLHYYFYFHGCRAGPDPPASSNLGSLPAAILLQRPQPIGAATVGGGHRLHRGRQRLHPHRRLATRAGSGRRVLTRPTAPCARPVCRAVLPGARRVRPDLPLEPDAGGIRHRRGVPLCGHAGAALRAARHANRC